MTSKEYRMLGRLLRKNVQGLVQHITLLHKEMLQKDEHIKELVASHEEMTNAIAMVKAEFLRLPSADDWEALHARIASLEERPQGVQYLGVYSAEQDYAKGDMVTHRGCTWHCNKACKGLAPGGQHPSEGVPWTMAVKGSRRGGK